MQHTPRSLPPHLEFTNLREQRMWAARAILAAHEFPLSNAPTLPENGAFADEDWIVSGDVITRSFEAPRGLNRTVQFQVEFASETAAPVRVDCGRPRLFGKSSQQADLVPFGSNPYATGNAFEIRTPEHPEPVRISWSHALRVVHDAAVSFARDTRDVGLAQQADVIDRFGARHGSAMDAMCNGTPVAYDDVDDMFTKGPYTELGRAIQHCMIVANMPLLEQGAHWTFHALATLWVQHGDAIEQDFGFSNDYDAALGDNPNPGLGR